MRGRTFRIPEYRYLTPGHAARHPLPRTGEAEGRTCIERAQSCAWLTKGLDGRAGTRARARRRTGRAVQRSTRHHGGRLTGVAALPVDPSLQGAQHPSWRFASSRRSTDRPPRPPPPRPPVRLPSRRSPTAPPACWTPTTWPAGARSSLPPHSSRTATTATSRAACCWSPSCATVRRPARRTPSACWPARSPPSRRSRTTPREPVLLNFAGVLLYELGAIVAAEALFRAAQRLDPDLADVAAQPRASASAAASRASRTPQGLPPQVLRALRDLGPRAQRAARRRVPAAGLTVSLCMIVKDEEAMLAALPGGRRATLVDEIDRRRHRLDRPHVEIAESFGAQRAAPRVGRRLLGGPQRRPSTPRPATGCMYLDADEVLVTDGDGPAPARAARPHLARGASS